MKYFELRKAGRRVGAQCFNQAFDVVFVCSDFELAPPTARNVAAVETTHTTVNFAVHPGTNIYSIDLKNLASAGIAFVGALRNGC